MSYAPRLALVRDGDSETFNVLAEGHAWLAGEGQAGGQAGRGLVHPSERVSYDP
jgi:hypothetical protein